MESTRKIRIAGQLEDQFTAIDDVLHDAIAKVSDEDGCYSPGQVKLVMGLARVLAQMASTIGRLEGVSRSSQNRGSNP